MGEPKAFEIARIRVLSQFVDFEGCSSIVRRVSEYRAQHVLPQIYRDERRRSLRYSVIDGQGIERAFPEVMDLYRSVNRFLQEELGLQNITMLKNRTASVNINIMSPGNTYRWHYDRNAVTAILFLNSVLGGELEMYANYRILLPSGKWSRAQRYVDWLLASSWIRRLFGRKQVISPEAGLLLVMRGDRCLHSVGAIEKGDRLNVIMTYDLPEATFAVEDDLDSFLYTPEAHFTFDPNYRP